MYPTPLQTSWPSPVLMLPILRDGTRDLHEHIERHMGLTERFASTREYRTLLERYYGFYAPLEEQLASQRYEAAWAALDMDFVCRRKIPLLESDLHALGLTTADIAALKRCPSDRLPRASTAAELAGCAYVMEGATLGGQVIGRHLELALGLRPGEPGAKFFYGYGLRTGVLWREFRMGVEGFAAREEAASPGSSASIAQQALAASRQAFTAMEDWLTSEDDVSHNEGRL